MNSDSDIKLKGSNVEMELWDAYNSSFVKIENVKLVRGETIPKDIFHLVCDILVKHVDGTFLLMKRDL